MQIKKITLYSIVILCLLNVEYIIAQVPAINIDASIALKIPGNNAVHYPLRGATGEEQSVQLKADKDIPVAITRTVEEKG